MLVRAALAAALALALVHLGSAPSAAAAPDLDDPLLLLGTHADAGVAVPARKGPCGGALGRSSYCIFAGFGGAGLEPEGAWHVRQRTPVGHRAARPARDLIVSFDLTFRGLARAPPPPPVSMAA